MRIDRTFDTVLTIVGETVVHLRRDTSHHPVATTYMGVAPSMGAMLLGGSRGGAVPLAIETTSTTYLDGRARRRRS